MNLPRANLLNQASYQNSSSPVAVALEQTAGIGHRLKRVLRVVKEMSTPTRMNEQQSQARHWKGTKKGDIPISLPSRKAKLWDQEDLGYADAEKKNLILSMRGISLK